jgi:hypothetical protein
MGRTETDEPDVQPLAAARSHLKSQAGAQKKKSCKRKLCPCGREIKRAEERIDEDP